ncbi:MAG: HlyD family efflux transporter periplasmic adaptor subunit [Pirellulaceae bacterium]
MNENPTASPNPMIFPKLRADLSYTVHQQFGDVWYAVQDPLNGKFLRLGRKEYLLASAMNGARSPAELLSAVGEVAPEVMATESDVQQLTEWLGKAGMLHNPSAIPQAQAAHRKIVFNPMYTRVPLISGPRLERIATWFAPLVCWPVLLAVTIGCVASAILVLLNWEEYCLLTSNLFVADGRLWWIVAWLILKSVHELGHAVIAVKVGSQIRAAGISFIFLAPVPYVDISDLWTISNRWHRILCSAGGMLVELVCAAIAACVALHTSNESLQYFCCAVAATGTVATLAFNANPLLRFDGYFIVSDLLQRPNLWTEGQLAVKRFVAKLLHPWSSPASAIHPAYVLYGLACYQYRVMMLVTLAAWTILVWQGVGLAIVAWGAYAMVVVPLQRSIASRRLSRIAAQTRNSQSNSPVEPTAEPAITTSTNPATVNGQAAWMSNENVWACAIALGVGVALWTIPSPVQPTAPGVVGLHEPATVRSDTDGFLVRVHARAGQRVAQGDVLAVLENSELTLLCAQKQNEIDRMKESIHARRSRGELSELQADEAQLHSLQTQMQQLTERVAKLQVRAPRAGLLVDNDLQRQLGKFIEPGAPLCTIAEPASIEVNVSASQNEVDHLRSLIGQPVHLRCTDGSTFPGIVEHVDPRGSDLLQEPLLAALYDGPIAVTLESDAGEDVLRLPTPRFNVRIRVEDNFVGQRLSPGQMAWVRVPGQNASLWDAVARWIEKKWAAIEQSSKS